MSSKLTASSLYIRLFRPVTKSPDDQRREFTFTVLIALITGAAMATLLSSAVNHALGNSPQNINSLPITAVFFGVCAALWRLARRGHYKPGAYLLTILVWLASLQLLLSWSFELPMAQLLSALVIAVAGVLLSSIAAAVVALLVACSTLAIAYLQVAGMLAPNIGWMNGNLEFSDAIGQTVIYIIIGGVLWLSNKEIDSLFLRAKRSEQDLVKERDQLEVTVAERTQDLERAQLERVLELQNFADFGRISASLLHDLTSPLTAASINLEQVGTKQNSQLVEQAMQSISYIERYIASARKQLEGRESKQAFDAVHEIQEVINLLQSQATATQTKIILHASIRARAYGSLTDFHRVIANLIVNAMQSYESKQSSNREVIVEVTRTKMSIQISIADKGAGIAEVDLPHIFDDFYSTKKRIGRGLGLGLANARRVITHDFGGTITVDSAPRKGTIFTIEIPVYEAKHPKKHTKRARLSGQKPKN